MKTKSMFLNAAMMILIAISMMTTTDLNAKPKYDHKELFKMLDQYKGESKREVLAQKLVKYFNSKQRRLHKVYIRKGLLVNYKGKALDPDLTNHPERLGKAIYIMDRHGNIYLSFDQHLPHIYHSSFLEGKAVAAAGEMMISNGVLYSISNASGHYRPRSVVIKRVLQRLRELGANLEHTEIFMFDKRGQFKYVTPKQLEQNIDYEKTTKSIDKVLK